MAKKGEYPSGPTPKTEAQKALLEALRTYEMTIVSGPAGVGKTYIGAALAARYLKEGKIRKIILTRPTIPISKSIGYFPGDLEAKLDPWMKPLTEVIKDVLGKGDFETQVKNENIEMVPFETLRGRTFNDTFLLADEMQNSTIAEAKALVTRIGERSITLLNGDTTQSDISGGNGLNKLIEHVKRSEELQKYVKLVFFSSEDVVRSGLCKLWVKEFENG